MSRTLLLFLVGVLATAAAIAAPAPAPRPWVDGWRIQDPYKRAIFERKGDSLTIIVSDKQVEQTEIPDDWPASRVLREVSGNFVAEVRLNGSFILSEEAEEECSGAEVAAGMVLIGEKDWRVGVYRNTRRGGGVTITKLHASFPLTETTEMRTDDDIGLEECSSEREVYLRLSRKENVFSAACSADGKKWHEAEPEKLYVPKRLALGVFAASNSKEPFKPRFDRFRLTLAGPKGP